MPELCSVDGVASIKIPTVVHIIYRLDVGGLETVLINVINHTPVSRYHHVIICLTEYSEFRRRIQQEGVEIHALNKRPGKDLGVYVRLWRLLRRLKPDIVHTYNVATIDCQVAAAAAGVRRRVHAEHGRDVFDLHGENKRYILLRRLLQPLIDKIIPVSRDLENWLIARVGMPGRKVHRIYNGIDTDGFRPRSKEKEMLPIEGFSDASSFVIGTVGRLHAVKDHVTLVKAFLRLVEMVSGGRERLRLVIAGDGPLHQEILTLIESSGFADIVWLTGERNDVANLMRGFDVFVLTSLAEGIPLTVLEAMSCALPVVATRVGGLPELVEEGMTGRLVAVSDPTSLSEALRSYIDEPLLIERHGRAGRRRVEEQFSVQTMTEQYLAVYDELLRAKR